MKVVVVGAGYAGTIAANRLARKVPGAEITMVNPRPQFVERVRLHQHIAASGAVATPLTRMLRDGIRVRQGTVDKIGDGTVTLTDGESLDFDHLFLAVGSTVVPLPGSIPIGTWEGAEQAREALTRLPDGSRVTVVGGGLTGIESAAEIAGSRPALSVRLVAQAIAPSLSAGARARVRTALDRLGVDVVTATVTEVADGPETGKGVVRLSSGAELDTDLTLWGIAASVPDLSARSGLEVNAEGRALVDEFLRSVSDPRIFVIGDCAAVPGARLSCATAMPQGAHAADTLARIVKGRTPEPYSMSYVGQAVSLGRRDGLLQVSRRDDTVRRLYVSGRAAALVKEGVCRVVKYGARTADYAWLPGKK
ncbi:NAD(P)/FAD-dependent oxidoreductase [Streptomyces sp. NPDC058067]|uniref:NAD(P)/FAD-dependent oxidoreductase n=1 Tax=Streptomyces sp. NPDC058067 TaxID=3346324 RepID=UPI0036EA44BC